uniref:Uncharacterized protein n=1 Tax=Quercus lobata TaxID=97700 RepID=A0A7N2L522_QUELO
MGRGELCLSTTKKTEARHSVNRRSTVQYLMNSEGDCVPIPAIPFPIPTTTSVAMRKSLQLYSKRQHLDWELIPVLKQTVQTYCCEATLGGIHYVPSRSSIKFFQSHFFSELVRTNELCQRCSDACVKLGREMGMKVVDLFTALQKKDDWMDACFIIECECRYDGWLTATRHRQSGWIGPVLATDFCKVVHTVNHH